MLVTVLIAGPDFIMFQIKFIARAVGSPVLRFTSVFLQVNTAN